MQAHKGPHVLVDSLVALDRSADFHATFVGSHQHGSTSKLSAFERKLHKRARPLGTKASFVPYRHHDEMPDPFRKVDIHVVPSQFDEPFGLVLLEGTATGLAVLATSRSGIPEVGGDAIQYFDTPQQLTAKLRDLIAQPALRAKWGEKARVRSREFTWDRSLDTLAEYVAATASSKGSTAG